MKKYITCKYCNDPKTVIIHRIKERVFKNEYFEIAKCPSCGIIYTCPQISKDEIGKYYTGDYYSYQPFDTSSFISNSKSFKKKLTNLLKKAVLKEIYGYNVTDYPQTPIIKPLLKFIAIIFQHQIGYYLPPFVGNGRVLDVGCGSGTLLYKLKELGFDTHGVEPSQKASEWSKEVGLNIKSCDLNEAKYPDNYFDIVNYSHVLEHLPDLFENLNETKRILKKGGLITIDVPNVSSLERIILGKYWLGWDPPRHYFHFTPEFLKNTLRKHGFNVVKELYPADPRKVIPTAPYLWDYLTKCKYPKLRKYFDPDKNTVLRLILIPIGYVLAFFKQTASIIIWAEVKK
ncbi:MAG: hypothetical protein A2252_03180 [Elusimicrobia bacterium RIFOXYA2_FULL_39_19]|nr:MAG: hypothetical protein A2252_03180 [Elusimicrobia bacterium RIFOXYA2_FULL_39_19]